MMGTQGKRLHVPLPVVTAILVLAIGVLAGGSMWMLWRMHSQLAHAVATTSIMREGRAIAAHLARQPVVRSGTSDQDAWKEFSKLVESVRSIENGIEYVSVERGGVTVFREQKTGSAVAEESQAGPDGPVGIRRGMITEGDRKTPVVIMSLGFTGDDGKPGMLEVGLGRSMVAREESVTSGAIDSMFRMAIFTIVASFSVCVLLVVWMMHREAVRERRRREEEHLVFAGVLANGIVHDFRNPMSSMKLDVQMMEKELAKGAGCRPERLSELIARVLATMERLDRYFQEFFYLSRPDASQAAERVDLSAVLRDCLGIIGPGLEQSGVRVEQQTGNADLFVSGSEAAVRRAVVNVLTNARQFSGSGDTIRVELVREGGEAVLTICDSGPGVAGVERKKIFDMFYSTRPGGTGLGLFLAKTAVERCGGTISVRDNPAGQGSCFEIRLPLSET